jgi:hypothetical protein
MRSIALAAAAVLTHADAHMDEDPLPKLLDRADRILEWLHS